MRVTEFSIPLPPTPIQGSSNPRIQVALAEALDEWRRGGAPPFISAKSLLMFASARVADEALARRMHIRTQVDPNLELPAEQAVRLRLIAEALLANAVAHAHPSGVIGEIDLTCRLHDTGHIILEVSDDGVGLPERFEFESHGRGGMSIVSVLAHQLGANVQLKSGACGLQVEVSTPPDPIGAK